MISLNHRKGDTNVHLIRPSKIGEDPIARGTMPKSKYEENENTKSYPLRGVYLSINYRVFLICVPLTGGIHPVEREVTNDVRY